MSTSESLASRETDLLKPAVKGAEGKRTFDRVLTWSALHKLMYLGGDLLAISLAHMLAIRFMEQFLRVPINGLNLLESYRVYIPFFAAVLYLFDGYKSPELRRPEQELERSCKAVVVSFVGIVLFHFVVFRSELFFRYLVVSWFALAVILLVAMRFAFRAVHAKLWKAGLCRRRAVLIGSPAGLSEYQQLLSIQRHHAYDLVCVLVDSAESESPVAKIPHGPLLGALNQCERALASTEANVLIVAHPSVLDGQQWLAELLRRCKQLRVDVELYPCVLGTSNMNYDLDEFSGCFRFSDKAEWSATVQRGIKRGMDVVIGLIGSIVTLLLTPIMWLLVNLEDRGPVFYMREFVDSDGQIRYYPKFRTMLKNADAVLHGDPELKAAFISQYKLKDDPRLLRVGRFVRRFSLDEFPQFFSVLSGKLTFVGPRVISGEERHRYGALLPKLLSSKPGLTGFWQVMGRQTTTYQERVCMDMFYIDRWSIWLDLVIIAKTLWKVLKTEGAY
jgi:exopolysaccharide biosynthesis polyprenyl glycosylphosphotransferase